MKSRFRFLSLTLILALLAATFPLIAPTANAQDDCPPDLEGDDCELFNSARSFVGDASSFNITDYTFTFQIRTNGETTLLETEGAGPVLFEDGQIVGLDVSFNPATLTTVEDVQSGGGVLRINDDGAFLGIYEDDDSLSWSGLASDAEVDGTSADDLGGMLDDLDLGGQDFGNIVTVSRADDQTVDGRTVAVFLAEIDPAGFVRSPFFTELASQAAVGLLGQQDLDPTLAAILVQTLLDRVATDLEENNSIQATLNVDPETLEITYFGLLVDLNIDLSFARGFSPDLDTMIPEGGLGIGVDLQANIGDYNADFEVVTPDDYEDLSGDLAALLSEALGGGLPFDLGFSPAEDSGVSAESSEFTITVGDTTSGTLGDDNESDTYTFEANAGDELQIAVRAVNPDDFLDPIVELYGLDGTLLDQNDDASNPPADFELGFFDSFLTYTVEEDGQYIIMVSSVFPVEDAEYDLFLVPAE